eukprot:gene26746-35428_t
MDSSVKYLATPVEKFDDTFSAIGDDVHPFTSSTHDDNFITEKREEKRDDSSPKRNPKLILPKIQQVGRRVLLKVFVPKAIEKADVIRCGRE